MLQDGVGPPGQEVDIEPPPLPRARPAEGEPVHPRVFGHEGVDLAQQRRHALHLVDDNPPAARSGLHLLPEGVRAPAEIEDRLHPEQVEPEGVAGQLLPEPGRLPGGARAEQEEGA